jgi:hypothetical protein
MFSGREPDGLISTCSEIAIAIGAPDTLAVARRVCLVPAFLAVRIDPISALRHK